MLAAGIKVTALFSPEHGLAGAEDQSDICRHARTTPPVCRFSASIRHHRRRIQPEMLKNVDALVFDIQDVGARFYTYSCTMLYSMEEAATKHLPFYVLDRPNPITGVHVEGPILDPDLEVVYRLFRDSRPPRHDAGRAGDHGEWRAQARTSDLHVVPMQGWDRGDWFDSTGLPWVDPSPNHAQPQRRHFCTRESRCWRPSPNYSVGRGTDSPFEQIGADWIHGRELAGFLNGRFIPGVRVYPTRFRPPASNFSGKDDGGRAIRRHQPRHLRQHPARPGTRLRSYQALSGED